MNVYRVIGVYDGVAKNRYFRPDFRGGELLRLREFPKAGQTPAGGGSLPQQDPLGFLDDEQSFLHDYRTGPRNLEGQFLLAALEPGRAQPAKRAGRTPRVLG